TGWLRLAVENLRQAAVDLGQAFGLLEPLRGRAAPAVRLDPQLIAAAEFSARSLDLSLQTQGEAKTAVRADVVRIEAEVRAAGSFRFRELTLLPEADPEEVASVGVVRLETHGLAGDGLRFRQLALLLEG